MRARPALRGKWVGLPDQAGEFGQGIIVRLPMLIAAAMIIVSRERSVRISIGHRDDASPSGKVLPPNSKF